MITNEEFEELQNKQYSQNDWLWFYTQAVEKLVREKMEQQLADTNAALNLAIAYIKRMACDGMSHEYALTFGDIHARSILAAIDKKLK
jgi:hypothetical protein